MAIKKQSKRRMLVAQKRIKHGQDVLRQVPAFSKIEHCFWRWFCKTSQKSFICIWHPEHIFWKVALVGDLPGNRRLAKPLFVQLTYNKGEWIVCDDFYAIHVAGPTIHKAMSRFRRTFSGFIDALSVREDRLNVGMKGVLAYLREMTED